jgi:hypothetical protein
MQSMQQQPMVRFLERLFAYDRERHKNTMATVGNLPDDLWAWHVWDKTGIPTAPPLTDNKGLCRPLRVACPLNNDRPLGCEIGYWPVGHIADKTNPWQDFLGLRGMEEAVKLLRDDTSRGFAWNYAHGVYRAGEEVGLSEPPPVARLRAMIGRNVPTLALGPVMTAEDRRRIEAEFEARRGKEGEE